MLLHGLLLNLVWSSAIGTGNLVWLSVIGTGYLAWLSVIGTTQKANYELEMQQCSKYEILIS